MYTLNAYLTGHELRLYPAQTLAADSVAFDKIHFDFDDSWDGLGKVALFWDAEGNASPYGVMLDDRDDATVPWEALKDSGCIRFGVYGVSGSGADAVRATSTLVNYSLPEGAWSDDQGEPTPAQQTLIEQAIAALNEAVEQTSEDVATTGANVVAAQAAQQAAETAQSGAQAAQGQAQGIAQQAATSATQAATSATQAQGFEAGAQAAQGAAEAARDAAQGYAGDAAASAQKAEQAATTAGYMRFEIDERGHLIYTRVGYHDTMFSLRDGHLILGVS